MEVLQHVFRFITNYFALFLTAQSVRFGNRSIQKLVMPVLPGVTESKKSPRREPRANLHGYCNPVILCDPQVKPVQYPYREKNCTSQQEPPGGSGKTGEYVSQPRPYAEQTNDVCHISPLERNVVVHIIEPFGICLGLFLSGLSTFRTGRLAFTL